MSGDATSKAKKSLIRTFHSWGAGLVVSTLVLGVVMLLVGLYRFARGRADPSSVTVSGEGHSTPSWESSSSSPLCKVDLPLVADREAVELLSRTKALLDDAGRFPFEKPGSSSINRDETTLLNEAAPAESKKLSCAAAVHGTYPLGLLSQIWSGMRAGDTVVDLGAGIGYAMVAAALLTNMSGRGVELSPSRAETACQVLQITRDILLNASLEIGALDDGGKRTFEIWQGDILNPPPALLSPPSNGELVVFSYANCFGPNFIDRILQLVSAVPYDKVKLMISVLPKNQTALELYGLRRLTSPGIHTYSKEALRN